jgi:uncharacterized membrane protein
MNKNTFISELSRKLRGLPKPDYDDAMNYYIEYFLDAGIDELTDVTPLIGSVDEVAARILEECTDKQVEKVAKEGGVKNSTKAIWFILLGIIAAPIAFPVAFSIIIVIITLIVCAVAVVVALLAASVGVVITGLAAIPAIFWAETGSQAMVLLGVACVAISIGTLMCIAFYKIGELLIKSIIKLIRYISKKRSDSKAKKAQETLNPNLSNKGFENVSGEEIHQRGGEV